MSKRQRLAALRAELAEATDGFHIGALRASIAVLDRQIVKDELVEALGHESLDRSPKKNWVERAGQLPAAIQHMAKDIHEERGLPLDQAIPIAISQAKKLAAKGNKKYVAAVAEWEALKAKNKAKGAAKG